MHPNPRIEGMSFILSFIYLKEDKEEESDINKLCDMFRERGYLFEDYTVLPVRDLQAKVIAGKHYGKTIYDFQNDIGKLAEETRDPELFKKALSEKLKGQYSRITGAEDNLEIVTKCIGKHLLSL